MLELPNVTLLFVETRAHKITRRVILDCMAKVRFGDVLIYTDKPGDISIDGLRYVLCEDFPDKKQAGKFYYAQAMGGVETDFALMLEWDAGIYDPGMWLPEFLNYDYVGAPWLTRPEEYGTLDVGNGGFTLMSRRLGRFIIDNFRSFPVYTDWDLCRMQRRHYQAAGFKWPDRDLAGRFSWELVARNPCHFGYHGAFTWPAVLLPSEVIERAKLMLESPYLTSKMKDLVERGPALWLEQALGPELWAKYLHAHAVMPQAQPFGNRRIISPTRRQDMLKLIASRQQAMLEAQRKGLKA